MLKGHEAVKVVIPALKPSLKLEKGEGTPKFIPIIPKISVPASKDIPNKTT